MKNLNYYLDKYEAERIDTNLYEDTYIGWALKHFVDEEQILNPYLDITLRLDLTEAEKNYQNNFQDKHSSFTGFLIWKLLKVLKNHSHFFWRFIENNWYQINNPPLFFPIAVGGKARFGEVIIEDVTKKEWLEFSQLYRRSIDDIFGNPILASEREYAYYLGQLVGNLPNLDFSSFVIHTSRKATQNFFYFGKRIRNKDSGELTVALSIKFHHSNSDPFVLDLLVKDYENQLKLVD